MKASFLLTIVIPTYNGSSTIRTLLDLILPQYDERIEYLVLNNASTDNTLEILEDYQKKYPFIRIKNQITNIGPDGNFLDCFREAKGKFVHLISDDDVIFAGAITKILEFLEQNPKVALVYMNTIGFYGNYVGDDSCDQKELARHIDTFVTTDRKRFMAKACNYWGFVSSFICSTEKFRIIENPEQFFNTYWLQSYIHILCVTEKDALLGVIGHPCIGAGRYINVNNFDSVLVDGIYYKKMLEFAVEKSYFDKHQLNFWYQKRFFMLARHNIIKEKAIGIKKMRIKGLFEMTRQYPKAWITLYPFLLVPSFVCKLYNKIYRKKKGIGKEGGINRLED